MAQPKHQLAAGLKRNRLNLEDKIRILNYASKNPKMSCRDIGIYPFGQMLQEEVFKIKEQLADENLINFTASNG